MKAMRLCWTGPSCRGGQLVPGHCAAPVEADAGGDAIVRLAMVHAKAALRAATRRAATPIHRVTAPVGRFRRAKQHRTPSRNRTSRPGRGSPGVRGPGGTARPFSPGARSPFRRRSTPSRGSADASPIWPNLDDAGSRPGRPDRVLPEGRELACRTGESVPRTVPILAVRRLTSERQGADWPEPRTENWKPSRRSPEPCGRRAAGPRVRRLRGIPRPGACGPGSGGGPGPVTPVEGARLLSGAR